MAGTVTGPGKKFGVESITFPMVNSGSTAVGDVLTLNPLTGGLSGGEYSAMRVPVAADLDSGVVGVALEAGSNGETVPFMFQGYCYATVALGASGLAIGDKLVLVASARTFKVVADTGASAGVDQKVYARSLEANAGTSGTATVKVFLLGISGFGAVEA